MFYDFVTKCTDIFLSFFGVERMREAFALQRLLTFFFNKNIGIIQVLAFEMLSKH